MTFLIIRYALFPLNKKKGSHSLAAFTHSNQRFIVTESAVGALLADLSQAVDAKGNLHLFFPEALPVAAPLILFRMKRTGFSSCMAFAESKGLEVTARR